MASVHGKPEEGVECEFLPMAFSTPCHASLLGQLFEGHFPGTNLHRFLSRAAFMFSPLQTPSGLCTYEDIDESNYVEYQTMPSGKWHAAKFCEDITKSLLKTGFERYLDDVDKASRDCECLISH